MAVVKVIESIVRLYPELGGFRSHRSNRSCKIDNEDTSGLRLRILGSSRK